MNAVRYIKIALFFIIVGGSGIGYMIMTTDGLSPINTKSYEAVLSDATGLSTRSKVYMAGVTVGKIREINLEENSARIRIALLKNVEVHENAVISRKASSILGTYVLSLDPGTELSPIVSSGGVIRADTAMDMNAVLGSVTSLERQITGILTEFQQNQMAMMALSFESIYSIISKIESKTDEELYWVSRILESAAYITERTERILAHSEEDATLSLMEIRLAMENIRLISDEIAQGQGNIGQAIFDERLYNSLLGTVEQTEAAAAKLQSVLEGAGDFIDRTNGIGLLVDSRANYGFNSSNVRAGASLRLEPASGDRWYRLGINGTPEGVSTRTVTTTAGSVTSYEDKTETRYTYSIDAELARRIGIVTLRGGLYESSAGFGVDVQPVQWVALSGELFNFRTGNNPNLKGTVTVYPFFNPDTNNPLNWIFLYGGVYDALSKNRDFFLGGGLRFTDREIKGLAGLALTAAAGN